MLLITVVLCTITYAPLADVNVMIGSDNLCKLRSQFSPESLVEFMFAIIIINLKVQLSSGVFTQDYICFTDDAIDLIHLFFS